MEIKQKRSNSIEKTDWYYAFIVLYVLFAFTIAGLSLHIGGFRIFTISSGSMNPTLNKGSIIVVKEQQYYAPGDIISYYAKIGDKEQIVTHRVIRIGGNVYITKGDANQAIDSEVVIPRLVIGKVVITVPYVGYVAGFAKTQIGSLLLIILPACLIIIIEYRKIRGY